MINMNKINITAHAGCMNTMMDSIEAVEAGIKYEADIIEIDLNVDENSNLLLCHDIPKENLEYPSLKTVLEITKSQKDILLNVDVKNTVTLRGLKSIISEFELLDRVFLTGLTIQDILENREFLKGIYYFINLGVSDFENIEPKELIDELKKLNPIGININYRLVTPELITICKEKNMLTSVWTVDDEHEMEKMISLKVNSITTKKINILKNKISEMQIK